MQRIMLIVTLFVQCIFFFSFQSKNKLVGFQLVGSTCLSLLLFTTFLPIIPIIIPLFIPH